MPDKQKRVWYRQWFQAQRVETEHSSQHITYGSTKNIRCGFTCLDLWIHKTIDTENPHVIRTSTAFWQDMYLVCDTCCQNSMTKVRGLWTDLYEFVDNLMILSWRESTSSKLPHICCFAGFHNQITWWQHYFKGSLATQIASPQLSWCADLEIGQNVCRSTNSSSRQHCVWNQQYYRKHLSHEATVMFECWRTLSTFTSKSYFSQCFPVVFRQNNIQKQLLGFSTATTVQR